MTDDSDTNSALPWLINEDYLYALLLDSINEACATMTDRELKSWGRDSYARALRALAMAEFVDIQSEDGNNVVAMINAKGSAYIARLHEEEGSSRKA